MKYLFSIFLFAMVLEGCSMFQRTTKSAALSSSKKNGELNLKTIDSSKKESWTGALLIKNDSLNTDLWMQLWPKGRFTFSAEKGFEGEAEQVIMAERRKDVRKSEERKTGKQLVVQNKASKLGVKEHQQLSAKDTRVERMPLSSTWIGFGFLALLLIIQFCWIYPLAKRKVS